MPAEMIVVEASPILVGRTAGAELFLEDASISPVHARLWKNGDALLVEDLGSRFGTFVNGRRIHIDQVTIGDRIQFGTDAIYRVEPNGLRYDENGRGARLIAHNLTLSRSSRVLVDEASFTVEPDTFVGILGPSGIGKSTLLHCMAGFLRPLAGTLRFDDQRDAWLERDEYRSMLGYVPQDDVVHPELTIRENVSFAAELRFGLAADQELVERSINDAISCVGLSDVDNQMRYSGGQRKRLSVAVELVRRPRLLLLDEPTAALDPANEADLMKHLRQVTERGTTVVCTTHKLEHYLLFDQIIVFWTASGTKANRPGEIAYAGPPTGLLGHFHASSFPELYERLKQGAPATRPRRLNFDAQIATPKPMHATAGPKRPSVGWEAGPFEAWFQLGILLRRSLIVSIRNREHVGAMLAQPALLGSLVCLTQFRPFAERSVLFFAVVIAIWLGMNNSIRDLVHERALFILEQLAGLSPLAYLTSKWAMYSIAGLLQLALLVTVVRVGGAATFDETTNKELLALSWTWQILVLFITYLGGVAVGLLWSAWSRSEQTAIAALPLLLMPQLLLSAVATGLERRPYNEPRAFRPVVVTARATGPYKNRTEAAVDAFSMLCFSRPASLALEAPGVEGFAKWVYWGDLCHLMILVCGAWLAAYVIFFRVWETWPQQVGFA